MPSSAPLQLLLFRHLEDSEVLPYEAAIIRAFQGGKEAGGYLATGEDLGIQLEVFSAAPELSASKVLESFSHTLTIVLLDRALLSVVDALCKCLAECWLVTEGSNARHVVLIAPIDERNGKQVVAQHPTAATLRLWLACES